MCKTQMEDLPRSGRASRVLFMRLVDHIVSAFGTCFKSHIGAFNCTLDNVNTYGHR